jgi:hypothetical protein
MKKQPIELNMKDAGEIWNTRIVSNKEVKQLNENLSNVKPFLDHVYIVTMDSENPDKVKQMKKSWLDKNPEKRKEYRKNYKPRKQEQRKERREVDPVFNLTNRMRCRLWKYLKILNITKRNS